MAEAKLNRINLTEKDYEGAPSTMCRGCGHDAISASVMRAYFENSIDPRKVVKLSGIGCSSKTPAYFLSQSFGFNAVHGQNVSGGNRRQSGQPRVDAHRGFRRW